MAREREVLPDGKLTGGDVQAPARRTAKEEAEAVLGYFFLALIILLIAAVAAGVVALWRWALA